jgi:hypothetical protein
LTNFKLQSLSTVQAAIAEDSIRPRTSPRGICGGQWHCVNQSTNAPYLLGLHVSVLGQVEDAWQPFSKVMLFRKKRVVLASFPFMSLYLFLFVVFITSFLYLSLLYFLLHYFIFRFITQPGCISPAGKLSSILLHSMCTSALHEYHGTVKQLRYETHAFVPKGKSPCFACENLAELSNCYQHHCILTHFLALSGVTISLFSG